jgi:hypothetical protein
MKVVGRELEKTTADKLCLCLMWQEMGHLLCVLSIRLARGEESWNICDPEG